MNAIDLTAVMPTKRGLRQEAARQLRFEIAYPSDALRRLATQLAGPSEVSAR